MPTSNLNNIICAPVEKKIKAETDRSPLNSRTILLIDDEETVVKITEAMLKKIGHKILKAYCGQEAISLFQKYRNQIDLIICDMIMPKMNGFEFGREIRNFFSDNS